MCMSEWACYICGCGLDGHGKSADLRAEEGRPHLRWEEDVSDRMRKMPVIKESEERERERLRSEEIG